MQLKAHGSLEGQAESMAEAAPAGFLYKPLSLPLQRGQSNLVKSENITPSSALFFAKHLVLHNKPLGSFFLLSFARFLKIGLTIKSGF